MWKTVAKEEKRVKDLFENAKRRAQRRRAFYDSRLGDPMQLLRVSGSAVRLATNPETYTFNEDPKNLMPWASDPSVKIDRFDGRALLDYLPSTTPATIESGLRLDRDEDGIGNKLRFERWHDLVDKTRLHVSEEQCLEDNEEEWNDLVAKHHALIGKVPEKKLDDTDGPNIQPSFAFNYGTEVAHNENVNYTQVDRELTALEEENILDHLDDLTYQDRDALDALGAEYYIHNYYRLLRHAKQELDARVVQLKVTAVNLERTLAGKKPLKSSEIEGLLNVTGRDNGASQRTQIKRRGRRRRSSSPAHCSIRRSSPSYEPYRNSSSRSSSESPKAENMEFIMEFSGENVGEVDDSWMEQNPSSASASIYDDVEPNAASALSEKLSRGITGTKRTLTGTIKSNVADAVNTTKLSLAEKLKQRMRQGLDKSIRSNEIKRQVKEREQELSHARQKGDILSGQEQILTNLEKAAPRAQVAVEVEAEPAAADTILCIMTLFERSLTKEAVAGAAAGAVAGPVTQVVTELAAVVGVIGISGVATPDRNHE
ncbi:hypothetical protein BGZ58_004157 [Dissophora ornata]|nr:hypothetical protein BGZ58_004157 [Dissophora ornata]